MHYFFFCLPQRREREVFGSTAPIAVWPEDIEFLISDVYGRRCAMTDACFGGSHPLVFTRWNRTLRAEINNLVLLVKPVAEAHDQASAPMQLYEPKRIEAVQCALAWAWEESKRWKLQNT